MSQKPFLTSYDFTLTTLAPLFIGDGTKITKYEYIYIAAPLQNGKKSYDLYVLNKEKLFSYLQKNDAFYRDYINELALQKGDLTTLAKKHRAVADFRKNKDYKLSFQFDSAPRTEISRFLKNHENMPYIAGSSLKGAFRTAILSGFISRLDPAKRNELSNQFRKIQKNTYKNFNATIDKLFHTSLNVFSDRKIPDDKIKPPMMLNSVMRAISISDSKPVAQKYLCGMRKVEQDIYGESSIRPQDYFEAIRPGTTFHFTITVDEDMLANAGYSIAQLKDDINDFSHLQQMSFYNHFKKSSVLSDDNTDVLYLGGQVGFHNKTLLYCLFEQSEAVSIINAYLERTHQSAYIKKNTNTIVAPYYHKLSTCDGSGDITQLYDTGKCKWQFGEGRPCL